MKNSRLIIILIFFSSFCLQDKDKLLTRLQRQEIESGTERLQPPKITFEQIDKKLKHKRMKMSPALFSVLNDREMSEVDSSLVLAHFTTKNNSIGIICYDKRYECDHANDCYSLYIADDKGKLSDQLIIKYEDNEITTYEIDFSFIDHKIIQISQKTSSEYAVEPDSQTDTIVTTNYTINFLKTPFDTVERTTSRQVLKLE